MPRRGRGGRFVKGGSARRAPRRRSTRSRRVYMRARSYGRRSVSMVRGFGARARRIFHGAPNTPLGRPVSRMIAPTIAVGAELKLVTTPLPNGDSWMTRASQSIQRAAAGDFSNVFSEDSAGNNVFSVAANQIETNAPGAVVMALESLALGAIGRFVGG